MKHTDCLLMRANYLFKAGIAAFAFSMESCSTTDTRKTDRKESTDAAIARTVDSLLPESERAKNRGFQGATRSAGYMLLGILAAPLLFAIDPTGKNLSH